MKRESVTEFRRKTLIEWASGEVIEVTSRGAIVGYWVPRDEWARMQEASKEAPEDTND